MIVILCKIALVGLIVANLLIAARSHGKLIGYIVTDYKEGYAVDGEERPPQVLSGGWQRFDATPVIFSTLIYALLLWGAGFFDGGV